MPIIKLTKRNVDTLAAPVGKSRELYWDADLPGFLVAVYASGRKSYFINYSKRGADKRFKIAVEGRSDLAPEEARKEARRLLGTIAGGGDPKGDLDAHRAVRTFGDVATEFLEVHVKAKRGARTYAEYKRLLDKHVCIAAKEFKFAIGHLKITDVTRRDVARLHAALASTPAVANRVLAVISSVWTYAARRDEVERSSNPATGLERNTENAVVRYLSTDEFARLGDALREAETIGLPWEIDPKKKTKHVPKENRRTLIDPFAVAAIRLLLLTGARLNEVLTAKWSDFDIERGVIMLQTHKTARTSGMKPLVLGAPALEILQMLPRVEGNPYIIVGSKEGEPRYELKRPWQAVRSTAEIEGFRIHDLRHSFASVGAGGGASLPIIGKLLGHNQASTTQRYAHLQIDPLKRAADQIGAVITAGLNRAKGADVVQIRKLK